MLKRVKDPLSPDPRCSDFLPIQTSVSISQAEPKSESRARTARILIADDDVRPNDSLADFLIARNFDVRHLRSGSSFIETLVDFKPEIVLYDLTLPELNGLEMLKALKAQKLFHDRLKVILMSRQNSLSNVKAAVSMGATDYLIKPMANGDILTRVALHLQRKHDVKEFRATSELDFKTSAYFLHLTELLMREALKENAPLDILHNLTGLLGVALKAVRVSVVKIDDEVNGHVMASSDKKNINALPLNLAKYPEIQYVLRTEKLVAIDNLRSDETMHSVAKLDKEIQFNSMVVCPIRLLGGVWGVVSVRLSAERETVIDDEIRFVQLTAHIVGLVIRGRLANPRAA